MGDKVNDICISCKFLVCGNNDSQNCDFWSQLARLYTTRPRALMSLRQASGNFGTPITAALQSAGFDLTIITRTESTTIHPPHLSVIRTDYTVASLTSALRGQDAAVFALGPGGIKHQIAAIDAAEAAGVKRFIVNDFGWGPDIEGLPEFAAVHAQRRKCWDHAHACSKANPAFTWTGLTTGNPIDWVRSIFSGGIGCECLQQPY